VDFLLEGVFTIVFALFSLWILPNTPLDVKILSQSEREYCQQRLELDAKGSESTKIIQKEAKALKSSKRTSSAHYQISVYGF
jgi:hypothetical protein